MPHSPSSAIMYERASAEGLLWKS